MITTYEKMAIYLNRYELTFLMINQNDKIDEYETV